MYIGAWCCTENPDGVIAAEATCPFRGGYCYGPAALRCRPHSHTRTYPIYTIYRIYLCGGRISLRRFITGRLHDIYDKFHPFSLNLPNVFRTTPSSEKNLIRAIEQLRSYSSIPRQRIARNLHNLSPPIFDRYRTDKMAIYVHPY